MNAHEDEFPMPQRSEDVPERPMPAGMNGGGRQILPTSDGADRMAALAMVLKRRLREQLEATATIINAVRDAGLDCSFDMSPDPTGNFVVKSVNVRKEF